MNRVEYRVFMKTLSSWNPLFHRIISLKDQANKIQERADREGREMTDREDKKLSVIFDAFRETEVRLDAYDAEREAIDPVFRRARAIANKM